MPDFRTLIDLASERLGGSVLYANDDFFAAKENLIKAAAPVWKEHEYTDRGKWMDGWESRRRRTPGHDFCILRLGARGIVRGVIVDTSYFRGNYPEACSIDATVAASPTDVNALLDEDREWFEILPRTLLEGNAENSFSIESDLAFTHLRLHIFPDGGVARLRVHGEIVPDWKSLGGVGPEIDLAAVENGADVLDCSDMFFGPKHNLIMPGRALNMSDGWETRRRRGPGHDWVIVRLASEGRLRRIELDTNHFKGNYPDTASIDGSSDGEEWTEVLPRTKLQAHTRHFFAGELLTDGPFSHLRLNVFPDGGVSRMRVWGSLTENGLRSMTLRHLNALTPFELEHELRSCCGSRRWVEEMASQRPWASWQSLVETAGRVWDSLSPEDWLDAFQAHPRIGEVREGARWSAEEQSGMAAASAETARALRDANREYEQKFGFIFLVCASGRSADEMLEIIRERLPNDRETELRIAAAEQAKITRLRLEKLV